MRPREMKRLKKPEVPADRQVYEGAPLTVPVRVETPPSNGKAEHTAEQDKELQELKAGFQQAKERLESADRSMKELSGKAEELQQALEVAQKELQREREEGKGKLESLEGQVAALEVQLEEATEPTKLPELEEITIDKIDKSKVAGDRVMLLCELTLSPEEPYGKAKAILALTKEQVGRLKKLGGGNGGSK